MNRGSISVRGKRFLQLNPTALRTQASTSSSTSTTLNSTKHSSKPPKKPQPFMVTSLAAASAASGPGMPKLLMPPQTLPEGRPGYTSTPFASPVDSRKNMFPIDDCLIDDSHTDRRVEIVLSLKALVRFKKLNFEKSRLGLDGCPRSKQSSLETFQFNKDMFTNKGSNSTVALAHVTHLLFELLDPGKTKTFFRNCWPAHEKNQQAEYNRQAYSWVMEIVLANPRFFIRWNPSFSVFTSPTGERCLKFVECFLQYTMFALADRRQKGGLMMNSPPLLNKFDYSENPIIKQKQFDVMDKRTQKILKSGVETQKQTMKIISHYEERAANRKLKLTKEYDAWVEKESSVLTDAVIDRPDLFPENAIELIGERRNYFQEAVQYVPGMVIPDIKDPLAAVINQKWIEKLTEAREVFCKTKLFLEKHERLWQLLEAYGKNNEILLDAHELNWLKEDQIPGISQLVPEISDFFLRATDVLNDLFSKVGKSTTLSSDILTRVDDQIEKTAKLKERTDKINKNNNIVDLESVMKDTMFQIKEMSMKLEGIEWGRLSKCENLFSDLDTFYWSPTKEVDFNRNTGLTPTYKELGNFEPDTSFIEVNSKKLKVFSELITQHLELGSPVGVNSSLHRMIDAFHLSKSPMPVSQHSTSSTNDRRQSQLSLRKRLSMSSGVLEATLEPESNLFKTSVLDDMDEAFGGIMDEPMGDFCTSDEDVSYNEDKALSAEVNKYKNIQSVLRYDSNEESTQGFSPLESMNKEPGTPEIQSSLEFFTPETH